MASHRVGSRTEVRPLRGGVRSRGKARTQAASLNSEKCIIVDMSQGKAGGTLSPLTVSTKLAWIATKSRSEECEWMAATVMSPCGVINCKVLGPPGPLLTKRMREFFTYGSVGASGVTPAPTRQWMPDVPFWLHSNVLGPAPLSASVSTFRAMRKSTYIIVGLLLGAILLAFALYRSSAPVIINVRFLGYTNGVTGERFARFGITNQSGTTIRRW